MVKCRVIISVLTVQCLIPEGLYNDTGVRAGVHEGDQPPVSFAEQFFGGSRYMFGPSRQK